MKLLRGVLLVLFLSVTYASGLKVLGVLPFGSKSHYAIGNAIVETLHSAGHDITVALNYFIPLHHHDLIVTTSKVISPFPLKTPKERRRDVDMSALMEDFNKG
jgi:hypothetical protein